MKPGWIDDQRLAQIPREKLNRLKSLADATDQTDKAKQLQTLSTMIRQPKSLQLDFTSEELDTLIFVLKEYASPAELALFTQMMRRFQKKN